MDNPGRRRYKKHCPVYFKGFYSLCRKQVERFYQAVEILHTHPLIGRPIEEYNLPQLRQVLGGKYRIIYLAVNEERIDIITVHHSARLLNLELPF